MTELKASILSAAADVRKELNDTLIGMDYCLDWKPNDDDWSPREVLWHVLEDPEGGIPVAVKGILDGSLPELEIIADETHLTPEREAMDLDAIKAELDRFFAQLDDVLAGATDEQISQRATVCWFPRRNHREERSAQNLLEGLFLNHWRDHIGQMRDLRDALGLD